MRYRPSLRAGLRNLGLYREIFTKSQAHPGWWVREHLWPYTLTFTLLLRKLVVPKVSIELRSLGVEIWQTLL